MNKKIRYSNEQIFISAPSVKFHFLEWLQCNKYFDKYYLSYGRELIESLGYGVIIQSGGQKVVSFADVSRNASLLDCDFLHFSKEYRIAAQLENCPHLLSSRELIAKRSAWQYGLSLWDLAEIITRQLENPEMAILKSYNDFYLSANGGGIIKVTIHFQPKTKKRYAESFFRILSVKVLDYEELSGRIFFGCGLVQ